MKELQLPVQPQFNPSVHVYNTIVITVSTKLMSNCSIFLLSLLINEDRRPRPCLLSLFDPCSENRNISFIVNFYKVLIITASKLFTNIIIITCIPVHTHFSAGKLSY